MIVFNMCEDLTLFMNFDTQSRLNSNGFKTLRCGFVLLQPMLAVL